MSDEDGVQNNDDRRRSSRRVVSTKKEERKSALETLKNSRLSGKGYRRNVITS